MPEENTVQKKPISKKKLILITAFDLARNTTDALLNTEGITVASQPKFGLTVFTPTGSYTGELKLLPMGEEYDPFIQNDDNSMTLDMTYFRQSILNILDSMPEEEMINDCDSIYFEKATFKPANQTSTSNTVIYHNLTIFTDQIVGYTYSPLD